MKVVIAAEGLTLESPVAKRFGHASCYLLVDTATGQVQGIDNGDPHDETHAIIPQLAGQGAEVFVTGNIGPHAFRLARSLDCRVALARRMAAGEALDKLQKGELEFLSAPTVKHSLHDHHHSSSEKESHL